MNYNCPKSNCGYPLEKTESGANFICNKCQWLGRIITIRSENLPFIIEENQQWN